MMLGDIAHWQQEKHLYPAAVQRGVDYILATDFTALPDGRYEIEGDRLFALVQSPTTGPAEQQRPESHRIHTDIQFLLQGTERIGVGRLDERLDVVENSFHDKDVAFYRDILGESELLLHAGMFAVFFPADVHRPCCAQPGEEAKVRKVVIKIHRSLLGQGA